MYQLSRSNIKMPWNKSYLYLVCVRAWFHLPCGILIFSPFLHFSLCFLNVPLRFLTLGFSWFWFRWRIRSESSLSNTSCSHWASCCSRSRRNSSWDFCSRAARFSSSSRHLNSCAQRHTLQNFSALLLYQLLVKNILNWNGHCFIIKLSSILHTYLFLSTQFVEHALDLQSPVILQGVERVLRHLFHHLLL